MIYSVISTIGLVFISVFLLYFAFKFSNIEKKYN